MKKKCTVCGNVQEVKKSKAKKDVLEALWGGDAYPFRCNKCGMLNYK